MFVMFAHAIVVAIAAGRKLSDRVYGGCEGAKLGGSACSCGCGCVNVWV